MNTPSHGIDISGPDHNGVFLIRTGEWLPLAQSAEAAGLALLHIDLHGCHDKTSLLARLGAELQFPEHYGRNWDALADCLRDMSWHPAPGYLLQFKHAQALRRDDPESFKTLLDILDTAAADWRDNDVAFSALFALPDAVSENEPPPPVNDGQFLPFELDGDHVELNRLLKLSGLCNSGGAGKAMVASGRVSVNGQPESRKTRKIRAGDRVSIGSTEILVKTAD